jgi:hypothetical protein
MARLRPRPVEQRALTILKPLLDPTRRGELERVLRTYGDGLRPGGNSALGAALGAVEGLHYLSWFVIDGVTPETAPGMPAPAENPPILVLEASFDGLERAFLLRLAGDPVIKPFLDEIYDYCAGYPAPEYRDDLNFTAHCLAIDNARPEVFYVARPGQSAAQLREEAQLAAAIEADVSALGEPRGRRLEHLRRIWDRLTPAQQEQVGNAPEEEFWVRHRLRKQPFKVLFAVVAVFAALGLILFVLNAMHSWGLPIPECLLPPDHALDSAVHAGLVLVVVGLVGIAAWLLFHVMEAPKNITLSARAGIWLRKTVQMVWATAKALPAAFALVCVVAFLVWQGKQLLYLAAVILLGILLLAALAVLALVLIAIQELVDEVDDMKWNSADRTPMKREREDLVVPNHISQNHFVSVTPVKPGWLRQVVLRIVLFLTNHLARILYDPRGLAGIPSIHFARWQLLDGGRRLMFATNYDGGWGGYLGDFVAIAAFGMNAIWGNTGGFPRTFYLFFGGVTDEQRFKCYARNSQFETLLWYQRYPDLSLAAIRRNSELREELARLSDYLEPATRLSAYVEPDIEQAKESELDAFLRRFAVPGRLLGNP